MLRRIATGIVLASAITLCSSLNARAAEPPAETPLTVIGGDRAVWAFRSVEAEADETGGGRLQFAYALPDKKALRFRLLPLTPMKGTIACAALRGADLHVFFSDGSHYRLHRPLGVAADQTGRKNEAREVRLPAGALPIAIGGNDVTDTLFAVVEAGVAAELMRDETLAEDTSTNGVPGPAETAAVPKLNAPLALVEYTGNRWRFVTELPGALAEQTYCRVSARADAVHIVFAAPPSPEQAQYVVWRGGETGWSEPQPIDDVDTSHVAAFLAMPTGPVLVVSDDDGSEKIAVHTVALTGEAWQVNPPLLSDGLPVTWPTDGVAMHRFQNDLVIAELKSGDEGARVDVGFWPVAGGEPVHTPRDVRALTKAPDPSAREQWRMGISTILLAVTMLIAFVYRRDCFMADLPLPDGYVLASVGRRFIAFAVDFAIVLCWTTPLLAQPWLARHGIAWDQNLRTELETLAAQDPDAIFWAWMLGVAAYALYGIVFEAVAGGTPGKLLMRLRVANSKGARASLWAIVLRNVLRFEIYFMMQLAPTAVIMVLTRNRQRLGDLVARTVVIEKAPEQAPPAEPGP